MNDPSGTRFSPAFSLWRRAFNPLFIVAALFGASLASSAFETRYAADAHALYQAAKSNYLSHPTNYTNAWRFAKAAFDWAEFATNDTQRAALAHEGIDAARENLLSDPGSAKAHYYLGLNLGQLARTQTLGALRLVREMERAFLKAIEIDPAVELGGAERSLGLLYREAPGWPASIGSKSKARLHLKRAVQLAPENPDNHLSLIEAYLLWNENDAAREAIARYARILPQARKKFDAAQWGGAWIDWQKRWKEILQKTGESAEG